MPPLRLLPGLRVVARGRDRLQVGLLDERRVVLPRTPRTEQLLHHLAAGGTTSPLHPELDPLREAGLLVPDEEHARPRVRVLGDVAGLDHARLLTSWGLRPVEDERAPLLVVADGEVAREPLDPLLRHGVPHLVVRLLDGAALLGPFVVPGATACLRCLDAHAAEDDPELAAVAARYTRTGPEPPADPALAVQSLAWAARDLRGHALGQRPSTWSRTWQLGPAAGAVEVTTWSRHPLCGCTWTVDAAPAGKLGA